MQHLGLLSFTLLAAGLLFTVNKLPGGLNKTFSQRVANNKNAEILYSLLFISTLPILYLFFANWFVPTTDLPKIFLVFACIAAAFQILCTWVPERGGNMTIVHRALTGTSGIALLPLVWLIAVTNSISPGLRFISWVVLVLMLVLLAIALFYQKGISYALLLQVGYYSLFFAIVLLVTYVN